MAGSEAACPTKLASLPALVGTALGMAEVMLEVSEDVCPDCEQEECECLTPDDIAYLKAQAIWDDLGLGGL